MLGIGLKVKTQFGNEEIKTEDLLSILLFLSNGKINIFTNNENNPDNKK